jgi:uncharacterized membrane protein
VALRDQLGAWQAAGIVDAETAARIEAFETSRSAAESSREGISAGEAIAYIGSVVLLVGVGFLYGSQYKAPGFGWPPDHPGAGRRCRPGDG